MLNKFIRLILLITCLVALGVISRPQQAVLADDALNLDGEFETATSLIYEDQGVIRLNYPTQLTVYEYEHLVAFGAVLQDGDNLNFGSVLLTSAYHTDQIFGEAIDQDTLLNLYGDETSFSEFTTNLATTLEASEQFVIASQVEQQIGGYEVVEFTLISNSKLSLFVINGEVPILMSALSFDHYSNVLRDTAFAMVNSLDIDFSAVPNPRNFSELVAIAQTAENQEMGIYHETSLVAENRMLALPISGEAGNVFYVEMKVDNLAPYSQALAILVDANGNRINQVNNIYQLVDTSSYVSVLIQLPEAGDYTVLLGTLGNEWFDHVPQGGAYSYVYQKAEDLPFTGESASNSVHAFVMKDAAALSELTISYDDISADRQVLDMMVSLGDDDLISVQDASRGIQIFSRGGAPDGSLMVTDFSTEAGFALLIHDNIGVADAEMINMSISVE